MNEQVEECYRQMFAPEPIPAPVRAAFAVANKLASRIDANQMRATDLAIIAAIGVLSETTTAVTDAGQVVLGNAVIDTFEPPDPQAGGHDLSDDQAPPANPSGGPTGPMDAPAKPDAKRRALSANAMQQLTISELKVHAHDIYGYEAPKNIRKAELIAVLKSKEPL